MTPDAQYRSDSSQRFRRRALAVTAGALAVGMAVLAVVLVVAVPTVTGVDLIILLAAGLLHGTAAVTVGRRWEPGGAVNTVYVAVLLALVLLGIQQSLTPGSDAFWFLLVPVGLAAITLSVPGQVAVVVAGLAGYVIASWLGPGVEAPFIAQRSTALVLFAAAFGGITHRLHRALGEADAAAAALRDDVEEVTSEKVELERLDTARADYVSSVSHELRTPLTVILGMARTLDERWEELDEAGRHLLVRRVLASAEGLEGIIGALLDITRIQRGGLAPVHERVPLADAVDAAFARLASLLSGHAVRTEVSPDLVAWTDPRLLERVLDNLLVNAAKHTPAGTTVTVRAEVAGEGITVAVQDDGPGIAPEDVQRLGQQFFRADVAERDGLGLGLALVVEVLHTLDQELSVASQPGQGTTFSFGLRRARTR